MTINLKSLLSGASAAVIALSLQLSPMSEASAQDLGNLTKEQLNQLIHDYLMENPEVMIQSLDRFYQNQEKQAKLEEEKLVGSLVPAIQKNAAFPSIGNPDASVTMIEFFDYNCGYCKRVLPQVRAAIESDRDLRVIFVELPILGPTSTLASQAAYGAQKQDKYMEFHVKMMASRGSISESKIMSVAESVGMDTEQLKVDMNSDAAKEQLNRNLQLAQMLNITGTPAFIIGEEVVRGAMSEQNMLQLISHVREQARES